MDRSNIRKYQMAQLKILEYFDSVCRENHLTYFLVFGTLLGAIRHKGFIPWDADIDVAMYREDYEKIRKILIAEAPKELFYKHYSTEKFHISPHAELSIKGTHVIFANKSLTGYEQENDGIYIDIFPIDNVLDPDRTEKEQVRKLKILRRLTYYKVAIDYSTGSSKLKNIGKVAISYILKPLSYERINHLMDLVMQKFNSEATEYVAILTDTLTFRKQLFPRSVFGKGKEMEFEGHVFWAPEDPELFLSIRYGDYMRLPSEKDRWSYIENAIDRVDYGNTPFLHEIDILVK